MNHAGASRLKFSSAKVATMKRLLLAPLAVAATLTAGVAAQAQSRPLNIEIDRSTKVQLRAPAASVIVGNPAIADVTVVDANTLFIVGKGYGVTEVAVVDPLGRTVFQNQVVVTAGSTGSVRVWRGGQPVTDMACGSSCSPSVRSGAGAGGSN